MAAFLRAAVFMKHWRLSRDFDGNQSQGSRLFAFLWRAPASIPRMPCSRSKAAPAFGLAHVTGAPVKVGRLLAAALSGGGRWVPKLLLWAALVAGSACGALTYHWINLAAIWFAAGMALSWSASLPRQRVLDISPRKINGSA
jgi:hypothetical protein